MINITLISWIAIFFLACSISVSERSYAVSTLYPSPPQSSSPAVTKPISTKITTIRPVPVTSGPTTATDKSSVPNSLVIVGRVVWVKGIFKASDPNSKIRTLAKADPIFLHDTLITETSTQAQIVFTDDSLMTFRPDSKFYIENYSFDKSKEKTGSVGKHIMNLLKGGFRTITGIIAKANPSDYKVNTPVATIGVRGTDYDVFLQNGELLVGYNQGSPCVTGGSQTMCLDKDHPYAKVPSVNAAPIPLSQRPAVFREKMPITNTTFTSSPTNPPSATSTTSPASMRPNNMTFPNADVNDVLSSFCIQ